MALKYKHTPIKWRAVFAESGFIGASILLAFALQDWDEASDIQERTLIALCNVKSELAFNRILLKTDYIPRQRGMLAVTNAALSQIQAQPDAPVPKTPLKEMLLRESLRYSAWTLAGESGYLVYANFQLATEIGALVDYQKDSYQKIVTRVNDTVIDSHAAISASPIDHYISLTNTLSEWVTQTKYLEGKYDALFEREDFLALQCEE